LMQSRGWGGAPRARGCWPGRWGLSVGQVPLSWGQVQVRACSGAAARGRRGGAMRSGCGTAVFADGRGGADRSRAEWCRRLAYYGLTACTPNHPTPVRPAGRTTLHCAVFGGYQSGKSSLVKALAGRPSGDRPAGMLSAAASVAVGRGPAGGGGGARGGAVDVRTLVLTEVNCRVYVLDILAWPSYVYKAFLSGAHQMNVLMQEGRLGSIGGRFAIPWGRLQSRPP
jgi:hypothetical protein